MNSSLLRRWRTHMRSLAAAAVLTPALTLGALLPTHSANAAFPGQNGKIVFISEDVYVSDIGGNVYRTLYEVNSDGSGLRKLSGPTNAGFTRPIPSPDGRKVAFVRDGAIYVESADGANRVQVTAAGSVSSGPTWSPDSMRLLFAMKIDPLNTSWRYSKGSDLYSIAADGNQLRQLTDNRSTTAVDSDAVWSPDGATIAFMRKSAAMDTSATYKIYAINADGSGVRQLSDPDRTLADFAPDWSPDGKQLVFDRRGGAGSVMVMNRDGSNVRTLASGREPVWAPDGATIAYLGANSSGLYIMNTDGSDQRLIANPTAGTGSTGMTNYELEPVWQPLRSGAPSPSATPAPSTTPNPNAATVTSFTLIDATTDKPVAGYAPLADGATLDLATLPQKLTVRANTSPVTVGSVQFTLDGQLVQTENTAPYAIAGDRNSGADYRAWTLPDNGAHTLSATAFSVRNGGGAPGAPLTIRVTIVNGPTAGD
jgi:Tol biopolymer transport system component